MLALVNKNTNYQGIGTRPASTFTVIVETVEL